MGLYVVCFFGCQFKGLGIVINSSTEIRVLVGGLVWILSDTECCVVFCVFWGGFGLRFAGIFWGGVVWISSTSDGLCLMCVVSVLSLRL